MYALTAGPVYLCMVAKTIPLAVVAPTCLVNICAYYTFVYIRRLLTNNGQMLQGMYF